MNKRNLAILLLLAVVTFYALGTGFPFFYQFLYVLLIVVPIGYVWTWLNLRGLDVELIRSATRGEVGQHVEGQIRLVNRTLVPKAWLEVVEVSDLPDMPEGRVLSMLRKQARTWRYDTPLSRRGIYQIGQVELTSRDPFGLFHLRRRLLEPQSFTVLPATETLPDLHSYMANLPSETGVNRHWEQITTDVAAVRPYVDGDPVRRIHWPYTARMNSLMVKEFDIGISGEAWIVLDLDRRSQLGQDEDPAENTEELAVTVAASLVRRLAELRLPTGLAAKGDLDIEIRPDSSPGQETKLMEALAQVRASGTMRLDRFIHEMRPVLSRLNTATVITSSPSTDWVPAVSGLRRQGVNAVAVLIDRAGFGDPANPPILTNALINQQVPFYVVRRGRSINDALSTPVRVDESWEPVVGHPVSLEIGE